MKTTNASTNLYKILRDEKDVIISLWKERVKVILDVASEQSNLILIDHLPEIILNLSDILENNSTGESNSKEIERKAVLARAHGSQRANQTNYSLREVMTEYVVLRGVIVTCFMLWPV